MNDIPLIQKADINSINTSIIAIKKQLKQLNEALGLVDMPSIDTSVFVKKSDVVDVVESGNMNPVTSNAVAEVADSLEPVDTVTSGNMHSVTSNAVAENTEGIYFRLYGLADVTQIKINSTTNINISQGMTVDFPATKKYKVICPYVNKIISQNTPLYQFIVALYIDDIECVLTSMSNPSSIGTFSIGAGKTDTEIQKGTHTVRLVARCANASKTVVIANNQYNLMPVLMF
jgi:hypothetical protein